MLGPVKVLEKRKAKQMLVGTCGFCGRGILDLDREKGRWVIAFHGKCEGKGSVPESIHEVTVYKYRSLPCTAGEWSVCGFDSLRNGGGVLEWCFDQKDAEERIQMMKAYPQFQDLSIDDGRGSQGAISEHLLRQIGKGQSLENVRR